MDQTTAGRRVGLSAAVVEEPGIVLQWLVRLRWVAFAGQVAAMAAAMGFLKIRLPWWGMGTIIGVTGVSNLILQVWLRRSVPGWVVPAVLMLDVFLLTGLLGCAGGGSNPFCILYLVHVAMAVVTLAEGWAWVVVGATTACYALLLWGPGGSGLALSPREWEAAQWIGLALVAVVIAYFVGRMTQSLRQHEEALVAQRSAGSVTSGWRR